MSKWKVVLLPLLLMGFVITACPIKPVPEIQDAEAAIAAARSAGAAQYAPVKLKAAEEALAAAKVAQQNRKYSEAITQAKLAKKLADEARQEAEAASRPGAPTVVEEAPTETAPTVVETVDYNQIFKTVYFDFDQSDVKADFRGDLDNAAKYLKDHPGLKVTITGYCDPRGTDDYNMALGERRAKAVKQYLVNSGIAEDRVSVISKGESELLDSSCQDEGCWAKERRGVFTVK